MYLDGLVVDNFAGGGGASTGIEAAIGRSVDIAINHDEEAIFMHSVNHPNTKHYCEDIWQVDPRKVTDGKKVSLAWFSPDCTHHSRARGGKPRDKNIRGLAWVALRWAATVHPDVIFLENVEEFISWGPLASDGQPVRNQLGRTFNCFINALRRQGYEVQWKSLRACDYGAPTTRKRLFMIARCDKKPIVWPEATHGSPTSPEVLAGLRKPWRTAAECINWSIPCPSIFERKKPLAEATLRRIAKGIQKFVINAKQPFIVVCNHSGDGFRGQAVDEPLKTITAARDAVGLVIPTLVQTGYGERADQSPRCLDLGKPLGTIVATGQKHALAVAHLIERFGGNSSPAGGATTTASIGSDSLVTANLIRQFGTSNGADVNEPVGVIMPDGGGGKTLLVQSFLSKYYGSGTGQPVNEPAHTITSKDRLAIVTIESVDYVISDIGMRMLLPKELYKAQGFPAGYIIDPVFKGKPLTKTAQVRMCGNSVSPNVAKALVKANINVSEQLQESA